MISKNSKYVLFRQQTAECQFELKDGIIVQQEVKVHTKVTQVENRFGINQTHIDTFIAQLLQMEVDGRHFRTKYQIEMASGAPQAENFLWTILGNKVRNYKYNSF